MPFSDWSKIPYEETKKMNQLQQEWESNNYNAKESDKEKSPLDNAELIGRLIITEILKF
jgi:hypothetical protein